jgi:hypothetical protein
VLFVALGFCGMLYEDERTHDKEFNDSCRCRPAPA